MEKNIDNAIDLGAEVLEDIPEVHVSSKSTVALVIGAAVLTGGVAYGVYRFIKKRREKKGIIDGEILGVENELTEE